MTQFAASSFRSGVAPVRFPLVAAALQGAALLQGAATDQAEWSPSAAALLPSILPIAGTLLSYGGSRQLAEGGAVSHAGALHVGGNINAIGVITGSQLTSSGGNVYLAETRLSRRLNGVVMIEGQATSTCTVLLGGLSSAFPAIKRNGTAINFRLADDSEDAPITASGFAINSDLQATTITKDRNYLTQTRTLSSGRMGFRVVALANDVAFVRYNDATSNAEIGSAYASTVIWAGNAARLTISNTGDVFASGRLDLGNSALGATKVNIFGTGTGGPLVAHQTSGTVGSVTAQSFAGAANSGEYIVLNASVNSAQAVRIYMQQNSTGDIIYDSLSAGGAGDILSRYRINGGQSWSAGLDRSDSSAYVISASNALGTSNALRIGTDGAMTASGSIQETPRVSTLDPTTIDIPTGKRQAWYNSVTDEFRDYANIGGVLRSVLYT